MRTFVPGSLGKQTQVERGKLLHGHPPPFVRVDMGLELHPGMSKQLSSLALILVIEGSARPAKGQPARSSGRR